MSTTILVISIPAYFHQYQHFPAGLFFIKSALLDVSSKLVAKGSNKLKLQINQSLPEGNSFLPVHQLSTLTVEI
jgi:hypothetical protein